MANDSGGNPRLGRIVLATAAVLPPALGGAGLWGTVQVHPVPYLIALLGYEVLVLAAGVVAEAYGELKKRWSARFTEAIDAALRRRFSRYGRCYRRFLVAVHHDVDLKGLATRGEYALAMDHVFVDVGLVPRPAHTVPGSVVSPSSGPGGSGRHSIWEFLRDAPLALIGAPGGGKTTLLKHMTLVLARNRRAGWPIGAPRHKTPVLLFLREHATAIAADPRVSLADIVRKAAQPSRSKEPPHWFDRQLETGRCVVLLDGLDEVARQEDRRLVVDWVERQVATYPRCPFVLTSRPYGYGAHPLNTATILQVRPFSPAQIARFVSGWYVATERRAAGRDDEGVRLKASAGAEDLLSRVRGNPELYELAANPLLLTMIANVHLYRGALPGSRVDLYREICQVLLGRRREAVGIGSDLTVDQKEVVLRVLALAMMEREVRDVTTTEAADLIAPALASVRPQMDPLEFLDSVEQTSGLILERENGVYCFAHQTLQEYLAAAYILEKGHLDLLLRNLGKGWWRETILLYAAQADASPIVEACLKDEVPTVQALALAEDLAEGARQLGPELRRRVQELLDTGATAAGDPRRRRLLSGVYMAKALRQVTQIRDELTIVRSPISELDYSFFHFAEVERGVWRFPDHWRVDASSPGVPGFQNQPMTGMRGDDALAFAEWVTGLVADGWTYRLPTEDEAAEIVAAGSADASRYGLWTAEDGAALCLAPELHLEEFVASATEVIRLDLATAGQTAAVDAPSSLSGEFMLSLVEEDGDRMFELRAEHVSSPRIPVTTAALPTTSTLFWRSERIPVGFSGRDHVEVTEMAATAAALAETPGIPNAVTVAGKLRAYLDARTAHRFPDEVERSRVRTLLLSRLVDPLPEDARNMYFSMLLKLILLELRIQRTRPATEIIMLVRE